jgi:hypothetical protein
MNFEVNYLAIITSTIVFMVVGSIWYGPLFGRQWMKLVKMTPEVMKSISRGSVARSMTGALIVAFVTSFVLAVLIKTLLITTLSAALMLGFLVWLGFIATVLSHRVLFERSSVALYLINALQSLVAILLGVLIITAWPW